MFFTHDYTSIPLNNIKQRIKEKNQNEQMAK